MPVLRHRCLIAFLLAAFAGAAGGPAIAQQATGIDVANMTLEELMGVRVVTDDRRATPWAGTAAAIFVVTGDDIRRGGFRTVPEALRMVPGVHVARIDAASYAVGIRGYNGRFSTKLLVMIDGRIVYSPFFAGVFWERLGVVMEDIERIEVVRGPGAVMWGTNAYNGVINIITRGARRTQGNLVVAEGGDYAAFTGVARHGGTTAAGTAVEGALEYRRNEASTGTDGVGLNDELDAFHGHARIAWDGAAAERFRFEVHADRMRTGYADSVFTGVVPPYVVANPEKAQISALAGVFGMERDLGDGAGLDVLVFADVEEVRSALIDARVNRFDLDFSHHFTSGRHGLIWGGGYRLHDASFDPTFTIQSSRREDQDWQANLFVQDELALVPARLDVILGAKLEHTTRMGTQLMPNLRLRWRPDAHHTVWTSVSRAAKSPSIGGQNLTFTVDVLPPGSLGPGTPPAHVRVVGTDDGRDIDQMVAWEVGARTLAAAWISLDAAAFYCEYENISTLTRQDPRLDPDGGAHVDVDLLQSSDGEAETWGAEVALDLRPARWWRLRGAWSLFRSRVVYTGDPATTLPDEFAGDHPEHQVHVGSSWDLGRAWRAHAAWRYLDPVARLGVPAYSELDLRVTWRAADDLTLMAGGHDLLHDHHVEFSAQRLVLRSVARIPRHYTFGLRWDF